MNFVLLKCIDNEWYYWGTYTPNDLEKIVSSAFYLGKCCSYVSDVKIIPEKDYVEDV